MKLSQNPLHSEERKVSLRCHWTIVHLFRYCVNATEMGLFAYSIRLAGATVNVFLSTYTRIISNTCS